MTRRWKYRRARRSAWAVFLFGCVMSAAWALSDAPHPATGMHLLPPTRLAGPEAMTLEARHAPRSGAPVAAGQVTFSVVGEPDSFITGSVPMESARVRRVDADGAAHAVPVLLWRFGGDLDAAGIARFNPLGLLPDLRVGAAAPLGETATRLEGEATFRMAYQ